MGKILFVISFILLSGCSVLKPKVITEQVYVDKINKCAELPMPEIYKSLDWKFEDYEIDIDNKKYLVLDIKQYEIIIQNSQNNKEYLHKLLELLKICRA